jgi:hypothetical protein
MQNEEQSEVDKETRTMSLTQEEGVKYRKQEKKKKNRHKPVTHSVEIGQRQDQASTLVRQHHFVVELQQLGTTQKKS